MTTIHPLLTPSHYRFIDQSELGPDFSPLHSFAADDALSISVGNHTSPTTARIWVHDKTVVLGIPDARLPYISEAVDYLESENYRVIVRNSGGLAVLLDEGVLNLSLIFPDSKEVNIHEGYNAMVDFTRYVFRDVTNDIEAYEIPDSYCPGTYDLSINGKKFAGISQRRVKQGSAVQIYLDVTGSGKERARILKRFYEIGKKEAATRFEYPEINPEVMASMNELLGKNWTVRDVRNRILSALQELSGELTSYSLNEDEHKDFEKRLAHMIDRNHKALRA
ncbi:biotin/lipoate A/B protein ligase family protein [Thalassobacillus sp. CUG 92003]|uniref:lipoate--protein ligase family protein n=1 Tax=Thalassobacillus sp. CUG 92003 TaxID=2736641 RepID=UPI0015E6851A|nr:biotin/lipoate A/B protein ligase family protein [Thalassobacillus sp. CUG 92003]